MKFSVCFFLVVLCSSLALAQERILSPENYQDVGWTPTPVPSPSPSETPTVTPTITPTATPTVTPTVTPTPTPQVNACEGISINDLAGKVASEEHDGQHFHFNPATMTYDPSRGIWYDNQGGSTWVCQKNSVAAGLTQADVRLVHDASWHRSGAKKSDLNGRLDYGHSYFSQHFDDRACFECGLIRHKKGCFPPGSLVATEDGKATKVVEKIKAGDLLWNPITKTNSKVMSVIEGPESKPLIAVYSGTLKISLSSEHPVMTKDGAKQASALAISDIIYDGNGSERTIDKIELLPKMQGQTVINFIVENTGSKDDGIILVEGIVVGDFNWQTKLSKQK